MTNRTAFDPFAPRIREEPAANDTPLDGAVSSQRLNTEDRHQNHVDLQKKYEETYDSTDRGQIAAEKRDRAVALAKKGMEQWFDDPSKGLAAMAQLNPQEFNQALEQLRRAELLDDFIDSMSPEQLFQFTRRLSETQIFKWSGARDESGELIRGGPNLIEVDRDLPDELKALANDINLEVAKRSPGTKLYEPGSGGGLLDPAQRHWFQWKLGLAGKVENVVDRLNTVIDVPSAVRQLRPGDSYSVTEEVGVSGELGGKAAATGAKAKAGVTAGTELSVSRDEEGYSVAVGGSVLATLSANAELASLFELEGGIEAGVGGQVEFRYKNADDAARAAELLMRYGTPGPVSQLMMSRDERALLNGHLSAIELGPQAAASLGLKAAIDEEVKHIGGSEASAELEAGVESRVRLEFKDGKPNALTTRVALSFEGTLDASTGGPSVSFSPQRTSSITATLEQRIELRNGASPSALREAGLAALKQSAQLTVSVEHPRGIPGMNGANELELKTDGAPEKLLGAALALKAGDLAAALDAMGETEVTATQSAASNVRMSATVGEKVEVGVSLSAVRKHIRKKTALQGPAKDVALKLVSEAKRANTPGANQPLDFGMLPGTT